MEIEMVVWSDNENIEQVANIIHDEGYRTAEIRKESLGAYEDKCNWSWCKANMIDSFCVDLLNAMGKTVDIDDVDDMPMYRYVVYIIVGHDDDDNTEQEEQEMAHDIGSEKEMNVVMNIGLTTQDGKELDMDIVVNMVGLFADCTITPTIGFYKGVRENSIKVEIYDYKATAAFTLAAHFARSFNQECVALTANGYTAFIPQQPTNDEYKEFVARVDK